MWVNDFDFILLGKSEYMFFCEKVVLSLPLRLSKKLLNTLNWTFIEWASCICNVRKGR